MDGRTDARERILLHSPRSDDQRSLKSTILCSIMRSWTLALAFGSATAFTAPAAQTAQTSATALNGA